MAQDEFRGELWRQMDEAAEAQGIGSDKYASAIGMGSEADFTVRPEEGGCAVTGYRGAGGEVGVPEEIGGLPVVGVADDAFKRARAITSLQLPGSVRYIGARAFRYCSGLTKLVLPENLDAIGDAAFQSCGALRSLELPAALTQIGSRITANCPALTLTVHLGSAGERYARENGLPFAYAGGRGLVLRYREEGEGCVITRYLGGDEELRVPPVLDGLMVTGIADDAFEDCTRLRRLILPQTLRHIGSSFGYCEALEEVQMPDFLEKIAPDAFEGCPQVVLRVTNGSRTERVLQEAAIEMDNGCCSADCFETAEAPGMPGCCCITRYTGPGGEVLVPAVIHGQQVVWIGHPEISGIPAFSGREDITAVALPEEVSAIGRDAFAGCTALQRVELPAGLAAISDGAFAGCTSLTRITLPEWTESVGAGAFRGCSALRTLTLSAHTVRLGAGCLSGCTSLETLRIAGENPFLRAEDGLLISRENVLIIAAGRKTYCRIPDGTEAVGPEAFAGRTELTGVFIPASVKALGAGAFRGCTALQETTLPQGLQEMGEGAFDGCALLRDMSIPAGVKALPARAFADCTSLEVMAMPPSVAEVGAEAFRGCANLSSLSLPNGMVTLAEDAFEDCPALTLDLQAYSAAHQYAFRHKIKCRFI